MHIQLMTKMILSIFRLSSTFLSNGNELLKDSEVDSTGWQVMGAIALTNLPMTVPAIADQMGMTRQGAQKRLNKLREEGYVYNKHNPRHDRSPIWLLTDEGEKMFSSIMELYQIWMQRLLEKFNVPELELELENTVKFLDKIEEALLAMNITRDVLETA